MPGGRRGLTAIAGSEHTGSVEFLWADEVGATDAGAKALAGGRPMALRELNLAANAITGEGVAARLGITDPVDDWGFADALVGSGLAWAFAERAWPDAMMWTSHLVDGLAASDASFVWRRLGGWLEGAARVAEAVAALAMADRLVPGCVPPADFERLMGLARAGAEAGRDDG